MAVSPVIDRYLTKLGVRPSFCRAQRITQEFNTEAEI
jgi:hypothetical protein